MCALATASYAQTPPVPPGPLTLEQVLDLAEARSETVALARLAVQRTEPERARASSGKYPQLSASASYDRLLASEFAGLFDNLDTGQSCPAFALNQAASLEARVNEIARALDCGAVGGSVFGGGSSTDSGNGGNDFSDLPFGRSNTWRATLSFSQTLYDGGRIRAAITAADVAREAAEQGVTAATAQLLFDVTQAYYDAALSERLATIAQATFDQATATLVQTQAGFDAGTQPEFEVVRARVARDNQLPTLIRQRGLRDVALLRLKQLLEVPPAQDLQLADALGDEALAPPPVFASRVAAAENALGLSDAASFNLQSTNTPLPDRNVVTQAATAVRLREASLKLVELERKPVATLTSNYSRIAYPSTFLPAFERSNWSVGAGLSVPILTGGRQRADETLARMDVDRAKLEQRQVEELAALDTRSAWAELVAVRAAWEASAGTVQEAVRAFEIATVRFGAGVSTQLELSDSRLLLQQAEANRALAARNLQVARARVALLPNLPLGNGVGTPGVAPAAPSPPAAPTPGTSIQRNAAVRTLTQPGTR
jgi:outer membrane protein TolC